jgi:hypothetical protein
MTPRWVLEGSDGLDENSKWKKLDSHDDDESFVLLASETTRDVYPHHSLRFCHLLSQANTVTCMYAHSESSLTFALCSSELPSLVQAQF